VAYGRVGTRTAGEEKSAPLGIWQAFHQREVVLLLSIYFLAVNAYYGFTFWLPSILKESGVSNLTVTSISVIPFSLGLIAMLLVAGIRTRRASDACTRRCRFLSLASDSCSPLHQATTWR